MEGFNDVGTPHQRRHVEARLEAAGWGAFFLWLGVALWADVGWGYGLLGIGLITLAAQGLRRYFGVALEGFSLVIGGLFVLGGVWELSGTTVSIVPVLLVIAGLALLYAAITKRPRHGPTH